MNGILNILKPPGMTSHDVVNFVRNTISVKKAGHTGTLDPGAAGVLPVCVGKATRIIQYLPDDKKYRVEVTFGLSTTTQDAFGDVVRRTGANGLAAGDVARHLVHFAGQIEQVPPMTSAVKYQGKKLYELARAGMEVERKSRSVYIYDILLVDFYHDGAGTPRAVLDIHCSAGTYIRTICHELGERLGCGAYMSFLLRTRAGLFSLDNTITLEQLRGMQEQGALRSSALVPMHKALENLPRVEIQGAAVQAASCGNRLRLPTIAVGQKIAADQLVRLEDPNGLLALAVTRHDPEAPDYYLFQPVKVLV
ncbi:tRNA pseudouridine(55) synthase TruB [Desulfoscipio geothermicus]|uniref:tRNA pseudouridine synthase B n=1 Tax=Desulfoscipio geothermicus DSM 3669 TaxID=1121426 RepID=A0A1I6D8E0_9FIRM|nr:tRNA pseudouridine(55) synthase TruB [Desulfoscipio geothermicus]SFR01725.1 tRNA pseudouridine synthase B [Desulfoscipio geothermicus DSM 3669]